MHYRNSQTAMRVLYVAPRFHPNQIPVVKGWIETGSEVMFVSQFEGTLENHEAFRPLILGYSKLFELWMKIYRKVFCRNEKNVTKEFNFRTKAGFAPLGSAGKIIKKFRPNVVIVREYAVYNVSFVRACRREKIPCILYNQSPLWTETDGKKRILKKIALKCFPGYRMTPVLGRQGDGRKKDRNTMYVPFVMERHFSPEEKEHFSEGKIRVLCVGRYEERKNLLLLVEALSGLIPRYNLHLTIAGERCDEAQNDYYNQLKEKIRALRLDTAIELIDNLNTDQVYELYRKADLFILPSTRERASVSQLEAMSCSLPVICSDTNGTCCYVENGINGCLFQDNSAADLQEKTEQIVKNRDTLLEMGRASYRLTEEKYQFSQYYDKIMKIVSVCGERRE